MTHEFRRIVRFGITGCLNTAVDVLLFIALTQTLGLAAAAAQAIGYLAGTANSWLLNWLWVFRWGAGAGGPQPATGSGIALSPSPRPSRPAFSAATLFRFLVVNGTVSLATAGAMQALRAADLPLAPAKVAVTVFGMAANYLLYRFWVFVRPGRSAEPRP
jgi:putative flippase GtrA